MSDHLESESHVIDVVEERAKFGTSPKTGKGWSMSRVRLANEELVFTFNPVDIGDVLVKEEKDGYTNWVKKRTDPKHEEIMKALRELYKLVKEIKDGSDSI